jgi:hypothetical protein
MQGILHTISLQTKPSLTYLEGVRCNRFFHFCVGVNFIVTLCLTETRIISHAQDNFIG